MQAKTIGTLKGGLVLLAVCLALAVALIVGASALAGVNCAYADTGTETVTASVTLPYGTASEDNATPTSLITTYGVRAGSAGPDYVGVTNTNFDFTSGGGNVAGQFTGFTSLSGKQLAGLAIWGSSVNESVNPYYANLLYYAINGSTTGSYATTWMGNPETSSWGDSYTKVNEDGTIPATNDKDEVNQTSNVGNVSTGAVTISGLEYDPDIIYGANKYTNWNLNSDGSNSNTNMYRWMSTHSDSATYANNDSTNLWTQIYTMGRLAEDADEIAADTNQTTRYNNSDATVSALNYERATKGQMLYIAAAIENGVTVDGATVKPSKKTVAYLYAIDASGTAYFFVPTASGLLAGDDTGASANNSQTNPDDNYAANNSTINMGYMATLPFITNTYDSGTAVSGGIVMKVEDIWKSNPACTLAKAGDDGDEALKNVDVIIYNSTSNTSLSGTSGGKNSSGVNNDYNGDALSASEVTTWAAAHGFSGKVIAGDDFGTSKNQTGSDTAPMLYCQRNYTADKNARAAWAFSQVYPELYKLNGVEYEDATYCYWVDAVYHVNTDDVATVAAYMLSNGGSTTGVNYSSDVATMVYNNAETGYAWYQTLTTRSVYKGTYAYYTGSSRASYYGGGTEAEEPVHTEHQDATEDTEEVQAVEGIGIFAPSQLWTNSHTS